MRVRKSHDIGSRNAQPSKTTKAGAAAFVVTHTGQSWASPPAVESLQPSWHGRIVGVRLREVCDG